MLDKDEIMPFQYHLDSSIGHSEYCLDSHPYDPKINFSQDYLGQKKAFSYVFEWWKSWFLFIWTQKLPGFQWRTFLGALGFSHPEVALVPIGRWLIASKSPSSKVRSKLSLIQSDCMCNGFITWSWHWCSTSEYDYDPDYFGPNTGAFAKLKLFMNTACMIIETFKYFTFLFTDFSSCATLKSQKFGENCAKLERPWQQVYQSWSNPDLKSNITLQSWQHCLETCNTLVLILEPKLRYFTIEKYGND